MTHNLGEERSRRVLRGRAVGRCVPDVGGGSKGSSRSCFVPEVSRTLSHFPSLPREAQNLFGSEMSHCVVVFTHVCVATLFLKITIFTRWLDPFSLVLSFLAGEQAIIYLLETALPARLLGWAFFSNMKCLFL